jgi:transcriptional regulator with XRE-family HTH domain
MAARSPDHAAFGQAIREFRARDGISQEELGHRAGLDRTYMGGIERGERNPSLTNILKIASALGVTGSVLLMHAERIRG